MRFVNSNNSTPAMAAGFWSWRSRMRCRQPNSSSVRWFNSGNSFKKSFDGSNAHSFLGSSHTRSSTFSEESSIEESCLTWHCPPWRVDSTAFLGSTSVRRGAFKCEVFPGNPIEGVKSPSISEISKNVSLFGCLPASGKGASTPSGFLVVLLWVLSNFSATFDILYLVKFHSFNLFFHVRDLQRTSVPSTASLVEQYLLALP